MNKPISYDLSASGGPASITVAELTELAAQAKSKVKRSARGWTLLTQLEVLALSWFVDLYLADTAPATSGEGKAKPPVISEV